MLYRRRRSRRRRNLSRLLCSAILLIIAILALNRSHRATLSTRGTPELAIDQPVGAGIDPSMKEWYVPDGSRGVVTRHGPRDYRQKIIALTFDDGPSPRITPRVLEILRRSHVRATFFVIGCMAEERPDLLRAIARQGHAIGNHSWTHTKHPSPVRASWELIRTDSLIRRYAGHGPTCFRPPYGITSSGYGPEALRRKYAVITWTIPAPYGRGVDPDVIVNRVTRSLHPGDIILMHDGPGHKAVVEALPNIIKRIRAKGYRFVTVPELLQNQDH